MLTPTCTVHSVPMTSAAVVRRKVAPAASGTAVQSSSVRPVKSLVSETAPHAAASPTIPITATRLTAPRHLLRTDDRPTGGSDRRAMAPKVESRVRPIAGAATLENQPMMRERLKTVSTLDFAVSAASVCSNRNFSDHTTNGRQTSWSSRTMMKSRAASPTSSAGTSPASAAVFR
jgi:hypothetical protein